MLYRFKSNLFVPGHKMHNLDEVQKTDVNAIIVDLEDGCPDDLKKEAREAVSYTHLTLPTTYHV